MADITITDEMVEVAIEAEHGSGAELTPELARWLEDYYIARWPEDYDEEERAVFRASRRAALYAVAPMIAAQVKQAAIDAARSEQVELDCQPDPTDVAYNNAITDVIAAITAMEV